VVWVPVVAPSTPVSGMVLAAEADGDVGPLMEVSMAVAGFRGGGVA